MPFEVICLFSKEQWEEKTNNRYVSTILETYISSLINCPICISQKNANGFIEDYPVGIVKKSYIENNTVLISGIFWDKKKQYEFYNIEWEENTQEQICFKAVWVKER